MQALYSPKMLVTTYQTARYQNADDNDMNFEDSLTYCGFQGFSNVAACSMSEMYRRFGNLLLKTPWPEFASELYRPSDRRLSAKLVPTYVDRGCHVVSVTDPYGYIIGSLITAAEDGLRNVGTFLTHCKPSRIGNKQLRGLNPLANYTDRATAAYRRS
jgi:hypothetical protein